jgi:hypothetical protein
MALSTANLSAAAQTLGLGDQLKTQLADSEEERKKKLLAQQQKQAQLSGSMFGPATQSLFGGGMGPV